MPKSPLSIKATVTKRQAAEPVPSDMAERLEQLRHHQTTENAATTAQEAPTAIESASNRGPANDKRPAPQPLSTQTRRRP